MTLPSFHPENLTRFAPVVYCNQNDAKKQIEGDGVKLNKWTQHKTITWLIKQYLLIMMFKNED